MADSDDERKWWSEQNRWMAFSALAGAVAVLGFTFLDSNPPLAWMLIASGAVGFWYADMRMKGQVSITPVLRYVPSIALCVIAVLIGYNSYSHRPASNTETALVAASRHPQHCNPFHEARVWANRGLAEWRNYRPPSEYRDLGIQTTVDFCKEGPYDDEDGFHAVGTAREDMRTVLMSFCEDDAREARIVVGAGGISKVACLMASPGWIMSLNHCSLMGESVIPTPTPSETPTISSATPTLTPSPVEES